MIDVWNEMDGDEFGKVMTKKRERSTVADSKKKENKDSPLESAVYNNHVLSNQLIPVPIVLIDTSSLLINISGANILLLADLFLNLHKKEDILESSDKFKGENK